MLHTRVNTRTSRTGLLLPIVLTALMLQACGGGSNGSGGDTPGTGTTPVTPPNQSVALRLSAGNMELVSTQGLRAAETLLKLAEQAALEVSRIARNGTLQMDHLGCSRYTLIDNDANSLPSAGDSLKIEYKKCVLKYLADGTYDGELTVRLTAVEDAINGSLAGTLDFGAGLVPAEDLENLPSWFGSLSFRRIKTPLKDQLEVSPSATDDIRRSYKASSVGGTDRAEAYKNPHLTRLLDRQAGRASLSGNVTFVSQRLGGRVEVSIDPQMSGILDSHSDSGSVRIAGADGTRILLPADPKGGMAVQAELDGNGDGKTDSTASFRWAQVFDGYLWSEGSHPFSNLLRARDDSYLRLLSEPEFQQHAGIAVDAALRLQFERPLSASNQLMARLVDNLSASVEGRKEALEDVWPVIEADVSFHGAVVLIQPRQALRYGHSYQLQLSNTGDFGQAQEVRLRPAMGSVEARLRVLQSSFNTDNMLAVAVTGAGKRSVVMPGLRTMLNVSVPNATSLPLSYQWSQRSGPAVLLNSTTSPAPEVSLAAGGVPGPARAMLEVKVTDARGRSTTAPVELQTADLTGIGTVMYFVGDVEGHVAQGQTRAFTSTTGSFYTSTTVDPLQLRYDDKSGNGIWVIRMTDATGGVPNVGSYAGAVGYPSSSANLPQFSFSGGGASCDAISNFKVLERVIDQEGVVQRFAADFEQRCLNTNSVGTSRGSIRINSELPIRP